MHLKHLAILLFASMALAGAAVKRQPPPDDVPIPTLKPLSGGWLDKTTTASDAASGMPTDASPTGEAGEPAPTDESNNDGEEAESSAAPTSSNVGARPTDVFAAGVAGAAGILGLAIAL